MTFADQIKRACLTPEQIKQANLTDEQRQEQRDKWKESQRQHRLKKKSLDNKDPDNPEYYTGELNE